MNAKRVLVGAAVLSVILLDIWQHVHIVTLGYEIEQTQQKQKKLQQIHKQLLVEIETLSALDRIERIAVVRLGMTKPQDGQIVLVEKMRPAEPSPGSSPGLRMAQKGP